MFRKSFFIDENEKFEEDEDLKNMMNNVAREGQKNMEVVIFDERDLLENSSQTADDIENHDKRKYCLFDFIK